MRVLGGEVFQRDLGGGGEFFQSLWRIYAPAHLLCVPPFPMGLYEIRTRDIPILCPMIYSLTIKHSCAFNIDTKMAYDTHEN